MNTFIKTTLAVSLAIFSSTAAMGQSDSLNADGAAITITKNGRVEFNKLTDKKWFQELQSRIKLHGYAQAGYTYSHQGGQDKNTFDLKRVLFWAEAKITDRWSFLFMHDFSSVVQEYYTDYRFTRNKALTVRFGQFKNGLSLENPLSPTAMEAIDVYSEAVTFLTGCGSDPLLGVQYGRDLGLALFGETNNGKFRYEVDVLNGQGINKKDGNKFKDVIARLEYRPVQGLNIVTTGQFGRGHATNTSLYNPTIAIGQDYKRHRSTIGADYKSRCFNVHGEYLNGWDGDAHSWGAYVTGAVPLARFGAPELGKRLELVGSYDFFNFNTDLGMDQHKAIAGLQYWFYKKCRLQVQYVYKNAYISENQFVHGANHGIQCQIQVRFN
ncbi:MAG: porin [Bacteroidaceae bacterium]|nr:porin [Bacteroidaceae bacterium]